MTNTMVLYKSPAFCILLKVFTYSNTNIDYLDRMEILEDLQQ